APRWGNVQCCGTGICKTMSRTKGEATSMSEAKQALAGLTAEDITRIIEAARKPVKTEKEIRDEQTREEERANLRAIHKQADRNKAADQNGCQHEHPNGVGTAVVYVAGLNRLYCQPCQLWSF